MLPNYDASWLSIRPSDFILSDWCVIERAGNRMIMAPGETWKSSDIIRYRADTHSAAQAWDFNNPPVWAMPCSQESTR